MANQWGKWGGTVDTLANLSAIVTANEDDGQLRPVMENESTYVLHKNSAEAVSGDNIVAADVVANKWHRYGSGDQVGFGADPPSPNNAGYLFYVKDITGGNYQFYAYNGSAWVLTYDTSSTPTVTLNVATGTTAPPNPDNDLDVYYHVITGPPQRIITYVYEATIPYARHSSPIVYDFASATPAEAIPTGDFEGQEVISVGNRTVFKWFNDGVELKWHQMYTFV